MGRTCPVCRRPYDHDGAYCRAPTCLSAIRARGGAAGRRPPVTEVGYVEVAGGRYLLGIANVARFLSGMMGRPVTTRQADAWRARAARNGFPAGLRVTVALVPQTVWCPDEVARWAAGYVPGRGGAPAGERNGSYVDGRRRRVDDEGRMVRAS